MVLADSAKLLSLGAQEGKQDQGDYKGSEEPEKSGGFRMKVASLKAFTYGVGKGCEKSGGYKEKIAF